MNLGRSCQQETHAEHSSKGLRPLTRGGLSSLTLRRSPARDPMQTLGPSSREGPEPVLYKRQETNQSTQGPSHEGLSTLWDPVERIRHQERPFGMPASQIRGLVTDVGHDCIAGLFDGRALRRLEIGSRGIVASPWR